MRNLPQRNNNPLNLRWAGQREATGKDSKGFAIFPTPEAGWRSAFKQIALDKTRGLSVRGFINKFAPPNENDTQRYLEVVCKQLNVEPELPLIDVSGYALAIVMALHEGYFVETKEGT